MEGVLEEAEAPKCPADLPLHQGILRNQQNKDGKSLSSKSVEGVIEEAGAVSSSASLCLHQGLSRDPEKISVQGVTNDDTVVRENGKQGVCENGVESIECVGQDVQTKVDKDRDKETNGNSVGKLVDNKEKENNPDCDHYLEVENNKNTGDHTLTGDIDDNVAETEDLDGKPKIVHGSKENMDTSSEDTGKSSEGGLVDSAITNKVNESKCEVSVDESAVHEWEQDLNKTGCQTEADGHGGSKCLSDEKLTEAAEESEAVICNNEGAGKISGTEDSDQVLHHEEVAMERSGLRDPEKVHVKSKDAEKLTEDAVENEGVTNHDDLVVGGNGIGDSGDKNAVNKDTGKSAEGKVEIAEENEMDIERTEGMKERDAEIPEEEERKVEEKQGVEMAEEEMDEKEKERNIETAEREKMGIGISKETEEMGDKKTNERGQESAIEEEEFGGARGEEVEEKIEKSQEYKASLREGSKDQDKEKNEEGKGEEFADKVHASMGKKEARKVASESSIALRKGGMEGESLKQDKSEERNVTKEIKQDGAEEHLPHRDEDGTCEKQKNGLSQLAQSDPLKELQYQTCEQDSEPLQKETNKDLTAAEEVQTITNKKTPEKNVSNLDVVNAAEDSLDCTGKNQPKADEEVGERADELDVPNLDEPPSKQTEQNEPEIEEREESNSERKTINQQEVENSSTGQSMEERETLNEQEGKESNSGQSTEERETLNQHAVQRGNRGQSTEKRIIFKQQGEVQWDTPSSQVIKETDLLGTDCVSLEVIPKAGKKFQSSGEVTSEAGQCGEKNNPIEMKCKGNGSVTSSDVGEAVCSTSKIMSGKNSIARKSTSKMNCKLPISSKTQSIDTNEEKGRSEQGERGEASPAGLHKHVSSLLQHPSAKETPNRKVPSKVYVYSRRPERKITTLPWSTVPSQWNQSEKMQDSDDSDIEIISENIASPSSVLLPRSVAPIVCDVCHMIWNNNVLEAIFEGNKAVTVNSKITYGAILCLNRYADVHYWESKEQTLRNVLERADLGRNIGNLRMTDVIKWLNHMIRDGSVKCCDVFDAVYDAANANILLTSLLNPEPRQENKGKPVEETLKRKTGDSNKVNSQGKALSEAAKPSTHQDASPKVSRSEDIKKVVKSTHNQAKVKESPSSIGDVLKGKDTLKKSNAHAPKTAPKNISEVANKTVTHEKFTLKECSVNLGIRVQVPQQRTRLRSGSSSSQAVSKRRQSLKEVDKEVLCEKKGRVSGPPLSDKECADTEGPLHSEDKNSAEKTARKKFRAAVSKQSLEEDQSLRAGEKNEMLESESSENAENTNDLPIDKDTTNVSDKLCNEKSTGESEQKMDESEENKSGKNSNRAKEKIMSQNDIDCKRPVKRNRKPSNTKEKADKMDILQAEPRAKRVKQDVTPDVLVGNKPSSKKEKTDETDILLAENKAKGVLQDVSTDVLVSNSLPKQKKRSSVGPAPQSLKKQRVLNEAQRDSPDEDVSKHPSEVNGRLSPTTGRRTRGKTNSIASTDSESLSLSLENTNDNLSDSGARRTRRKSKSCASTDSRDSEDLSPSLENTNDSLTDTVSRRTRRKSKSCASTDSRDSESLSLSLGNTNASLTDTVGRRSKRKAKSCASTDSRDSEDLSPSLENTNDSLTDTVGRRTRMETKRVASADSKNSETMSPSLENTNDSLSDDPPPSCEFSDESDHEVSGKRSVSPVIRIRPEKTLNSSKVLKTKSQRTPAVKGVVPHSESSSDSCSQQTVDLTPQLSRSIDGKLGPCSENTVESTKNMLVQQLGLSVSSINLYCNVTDTKILTNGDMKNNASDRGKSIPALETMLKERSNLDGVARDAFDLLPFESSNFSIIGNSASKERFLTNQELLVLQNICVLNPENPDVDMFYQILIQILLARKRVLLVPNSLTLLLVAEGVRREFNRAKRKGKYVLYLAQDWDADKLYTAEDFWLGNKRPPNVPSVSTVLSMFCLWKNLEKRFPISFPIALEELCRDLALWDVDKIGICVKLYSRYCTFLYEEKNLNLTQFFLNQPFLGSQTELQKTTLLCRMTGNSKQTDEKSSNEKSSIHSFNVSENDVQILMKQCMEAEQAVLQSSSPQDEEVFRKSVQALRYKVDAYKKEINLIQKVIKETEKKKSQLLPKLTNPLFKDCMKELNKTIENLYRTLSRRTAKYEVIREVENMSVKEVSRASRPPAVVLKGADLGEDVSESMKELVYELLMNGVKIEEVRPALCAIVQNLSDKDLSVVPTNTWIRNFARVAGLKVITRSNVLRW